VIELSYRAATETDATAIARLVQSAYRGEESRVGWTTEADYLADDRIDALGVAAKIADEHTVVLLAFDSAGTLCSCCEVVDRGTGLAYFGMFAVSPAIQACGIGRQVLAAAEALARDHWRARAMEMVVIAQRGDLIDWYIRRGYQRSDETRPFPYDQLKPGDTLRDDLVFSVLIKAL
jgi:ribosomal protein S18 acetylase RimI-like enzyme